MSLGLHWCRQVLFPPTPSSSTQILNFLQFRALFSPSTSLSRGLPWRWHMVFRIFSLFIAFTFRPHLFLSQSIDLDITLVSVHNFPVIVWCSILLYLVISVSALFLQYLYSLCHTALKSKVVSKRTNRLNIYKPCILTTNCIYEFGLFVIINSDYFETGIWNGDVVFSVRLELNFCL
jgi:hypothetical protein